MRKRNHAQGFTKHTPKNVKKWCANGYTVRLDLTKDTDLKTFQDMRDGILKKPFDPPKWLLVADGVQTHMADKVVVVLIISSKSESKYVELTRLEDEECIKIRFSVHPPVNNDFDYCLSPIGKYGRGKQVSFNQLRSIVMQFAEGVSEND
jgi:hypothetical protein